MKLCNDLSKFKIDRIQINHLCWCMSIIIFQLIFLFSHFSAWKEIALELRRSQHFKAEYYHSFNLLQRCFDFWKKYIRSEKERRYKEQVIKVTYISHCCKIHLLYYHSHQEIISISFYLLVF